MLKWKTFVTKIDFYNQIWWRLNWINVTKIEFMEPNPDLVNQNWIYGIEIGFVLTKTKFKDVYF